MALGMVDKEEVVDALFETLKDYNSFVRRDASYALHRIANRGIVVIYISRLILQKLSMNDVNDAKSALIISHGNRRIWCELNRIKDNLKAYAGLDDLLKQSIIRQDFDGIKKYIDKGANVNVNFSLLKWTPLHYCIAEYRGRGRKEILIEYLLDHGARINELDSLNQTPLHIALRYHEISSAENLLRRGARFDIKDKDSKTPKDMAYEMKSNAPDEMREIMNMMGK